MNKAIVAGILIIAVAAIFVLSPNNSNNVSNFSDSSQESDIDFTQPTDVWNVYGVDRSLDLETTAQFSGEDIRKLRGDLIQLQQNSENLATQQEATIYLVLLQKIELEQEVITQSNQIHEVQFLEICNQFELYENVRKNLVLLKDKSQQLNELTDVFHENYSAEYARSGLAEERATINEIENQIQTLDDEIKSLREQC